MAEFVLGFIAATSVLILIGNIITLAVGILEDYYEIRKLQK